MSMETAISKHFDKSSGQPADVEGEGKVPNSLPMSSHAQDLEPTELMMKAVQQGKMEMLDDIHDNVQQVPGISERNKLLQGALQQGDQDLIRTMNKHDYLTSDVRDGSPAVILQAVEGDHPKCVKELARAGFDVNEAGANAAPIQVAAREGKVECAKNLIRAGCNVDVEHNVAEAPFLEAVISALQGDGSGGMEVAELLSDAGCNVNKLGKDGKNALHAVAMEGSVREVRFLVKKAKVDLDVESGSSVGAGYTALHMAIQFSDKPNVAKELIKAGCTLNKTTEKGKTALHLAMEVPGDLQNTYVNMLLEAGCNLGIRDGNGDTVLHICKNPNVLNRLIDAADYKSLCIKNALGRTPLHCAIDKGFDRAVNELLDKNVDPNVADVNGDTCLHLASLDELIRKTHRVDDILDYESPLDFADEYEFPLSNIAIGDGLSVATYKRILDLMEDIDVQNKDGRTAFHVAINENCTSVVRCLLNAGADAFDSYDCNGQSPYNLATSKAGVIPEIVGMLEKNKPVHNMQFKKAIDLLESLGTTVQRDPTLGYRERTSFDNAIGHLHTLLMTKLPKDFPMPAEHMNILKKSHQLLLEELVPREVLGILLTEGILDEDTRAEILEGQSRSKQCEKLLDVLIYRGSQAFPIFCKALSMTDQEYILEAMKNQVETALALCDTSQAIAVNSQGRPMLYEHTEFLRLNRSKLIQSMQRIPLINILRWLVACGVFKKSMMTDIHREAENEETCYKYILDTLPKRGRYAFPAFCKIMCTVGEMSECSIENSTSSDENDVDNL